MPLYPCEKPKKTEPSTHSAIFAAAIFYPLQMVVLSHIMRGKIKALSYRN